MGSSNQGLKNKAGYNQQRMVYPQYAPAPQYQRYQGIPAQSYAIPQVPYRTGVGYPQQLMYGAPMMQQPLEVMRPNVQTYAPPIQYDMANYAVPQRGSYIPQAPPISAPMFRDDSAIMTSPPPPPVVRRSLTPPPVIRSIPTSFPEVSNYFNPVNLSPAPIVAHTHPVSEIISQPNAVPVSFPMESNQIQFTNEGTLPSNVILPQTNYNQYYIGTTGVVDMNNNYVSMNNPNYNSFIPNEGIIQQEFNTTQFQPQGMIYAENVPNSIVVPNQPYQISAINQSAYTSGIIPIDMNQPIQQNFQITPNLMN